MTKIQKIRWIDARSVLGLYPIRDVGTIVVYSIDFGENKVLAGINCEDPEWCGLEERPADNEEEELGFVLGSFFVSIHKVLRLNGGDE